MSKSGYSRGTPEPPIEAKVVAGGGVHAPAKENATPPPVPGFYLRCPDGQIWPARTYAAAVIAQTVTDCGSLCEHCGRRGHEIG